jgi:putative flippase GtrA
MSKINGLLAVVCGLILAFLVSDFLGALEDWKVILLIWIGLPLISWLCLWIAWLIGKKYQVAFQVAKHILVGAAATVIDLKLFEGLLVVLSLNPLAGKALSFLFSTAIKYIGNKHWAFEKHSREGWQKEMGIFFIITLIGLFIDVSVFYSATQVLGPQFAIPAVMWVKLSVLAAAAVAAIWNFLGYKFLVFKK